MTVRRGGATGCLTTLHHLLVLFNEESVGIISQF